MINNSFTDIFTYEVTSVVLTKTQPFTLNQVYDDLIGRGIEIDEKILKLILGKLRDGGIIFEQGSWYELVPDFLL